MRHFLIYIVFLFNIHLISAQIFDVETLKLAGDVDKRINLVILSEGYQSTELSDFIADANSFVNDMFSQSPFFEYANYFNVYAIKVPSNESGSDHPGTATDVTEPKTPITVADTYFNTSYDSFGIHRLLYSSDFATISTVLANNFPNYDQALILVNSDVYGGSGGTFSFTSTGTSANEIAIHEIGHSLFDLFDEYYPGDALAAEGINMTQETNVGLVKWKNWMNINSIGIYQHTRNNGESVDWYRPHQTCKMRYLGVPFCSVCKEGMVEKIHSLVSPIDSHTPTSNTVSNPSFPIDFNLNLIKPNPNTLESLWSLNGANLATNVDDVSILETDLNTGSNNLTVVITDTTTLLKVTNHETIHVYTVTWTIDNSLLGVEDIESDINNLSITMHPNPANSTVNFKIESKKDTNLKVDIISLDGKRIKTVPISNDETQQVDISSLSEGIYMANFYANNVLVANKKLVKK